MDLTKLVGYKYFLIRMKRLNKAKAVAVGSGKGLGIVTTCRKPDDNMACQGLNAIAAKALLAQGIAAKGHRSRRVRPRETADILWEVRPRAEGWLVGMKSAVEQRGLGARRAQDLRIINGRCHVGDTAGDYPLEQVCACC
jgi:hypothetical protein